MQKFLKENLLGIGFSRIVFDNHDGTVTKVPLSLLGIEANKLEYQNALQIPDVVANAISFDGYYFKQEKLTELKEYSYNDVLEGNILEKVKEDYPEEDLTKFNDYILSKKFCIGRDSAGILKQYDYEDIKNLAHTNSANDLPKHIIFSINIENDFFNYQDDVVDLTNITFGDWTIDCHNKQMTERVKNNYGKAV